VCCIEEHGREYATDAADIDYQYFICYVYRELHLYDVINWNWYGYLTKMWEIECTNIKEEPVSYKCFYWTATFMCIIE